MPFRHGKATVFKLATAGAPGTVVDISAFLTDVTDPDTADSADVSTFGVAGNRKAYVVGLKDGQIALTGIWDATVDAQLAALLGFDTPVSYEYGPEGSTAGRAKYTGTVIVVAYQKANPIGGAVGFTSTLQKTGVVVGPTPTY